MWCRPINDLPIATDHVPRVYHISCCHRLDDFMGELWEGLVEGKTDIPCGSCKHQWYVFMFNSPQLPHRGIWYYKGKPWTFPGKNSSAPPSATSKCDMESVPYESSDCVVNEPSTPLNGHGFRIPPYISCYCPHVPSTKACRDSSDQDFATLLR